MALHTVKTRHTLIKHNNIKLTKTLIIVTEELSYYTQLGVKKPTT